MNAPASWTAETSGALSPLWLPSRIITPGPSHTPCSIQSGDYPSTPVAAVQNLAAVRGSLSMNRNLGEGEIRCLPVAAAAGPQHSRAA